MRTEKLVAFLKSRLFCRGFLTLLAIGALAISVPALLRATESSVPPKNPSSADISYIMFSPESSTEASAAIEGREVKARFDAEFSKLSWVFAKPTAVSKIKVESCGTEFKDGIDFFVSPGARSSFAEGGKIKIAGAIPPGQPVETVSLVFRHNQNVCVKSISAEDAKGNPIALVSTMVKPAQDIEKISDSAEKLRRTFSTTNLLDVVDRELSTKNERENWLFRFRSDGTYFIRGFDDDYDKARAFSAIGTFEVKSSEKHKLTILLHGWRTPTAHAWDGLICPVMCGETQALPKGQVTVVNDELVLESLKGEAFMVRDRAVPLKRTLPFADLRVKLSTLDE